MILFFSRLTRIRQLIRLSHCWRDEGNFILKLLHWMSERTKSSARLIIWIRIAQGTREIRRCFPTKWPYTSNIVLWTKETNETNGEGRMSFKLTRRRRKAKGLFLYFDSSVPCVQPETHTSFVSCPSRRLDDIYAMSLPKSMDLLDE